MNEEQYKVSITRLNVFTTAYEIDLAEEDWIESVSFENSNVYMIYIDLEESALVPEQFEIKLMDTPHNLLFESAIHNFLIQERVKYIKILAFEPFPSEGFELLNIELFETSNTQSLSYQELYRENEALEEGSALSKELLKAKLEYQILKELLSECQQECMAQLTHKQE